MMGFCRKDVNLYAAGIIFAGVSLLFFVFLFLSAFYTPYKYVIGIDAGSSHSELILYRWKVDKYNNTGMVEEVGSCEIDDGVTSLNVHNYKDGIREFSDCLDSLYTLVPAPISENDINIYLGATAGARLLKLENDEWMKKIFKLLKELFIEKGYNVESVDIIDGKHEGMYAWITANYLTQNFFSLYFGEPQSYGILDQGGASAQIAESISAREAAQDSEDIVNITLYGQHYSVYAFSNLCFGSNEWFQRYLTLLLRRTDEPIIEAACLPKNFTITKVNHGWNRTCVQDINGFGTTRDYYEFVGTSDYAQCVKDMETLIDPVECHKIFRICPKISKHRPNGRSLFAMSTYYYVMKGLGLDRAQVTREQFVDKIKSVCSLDTSKLAQHINSTHKYLPYVCARGVYILKSLDNIYKLPEEDWAKLRFINKVARHSIGWLMGYIISVTNNIPARSLNQMFLVEWQLYCFLFLVFSSLAAALFYQAKKAQHHMHNNNRLSTRSENTELKSVSDNSIENC